MLKDEDESPEQTAGRYFRQACKAGHAPSCEGKRHGPSGEVEDVLRALGGPDKLEEEEVEPAGDRDADGPHGLPVQAPAAVTF